MLHNLSLSSNENLRSVHRTAFQDLLDLQHLNLAFNQRLALTDVSMMNKLATSSVESFTLAGSRWPCDCRLLGIDVMLARLANESRLVDEPVCSSPAEFIGLPVRDVRMNATECRFPRIVDRSEEIFTFKLGSTATIDCVSTGGSTIYIRWMKNGREIASSTNISYDL